jgi:hypothetical protein
VGRFHLTTTFFARQCQVSTEVADERLDVLEGRRIEHEMQLLSSAVIQRQICRSCTTKEIKRDRKGRSVFQPRTQGRAGTLLSWATLEF